MAPIDTLSLLLQVPIDSLSLLLRVPIDSYNSTAALAFGPTLPKESLGLHEHGPTLPLGRHYQRRVLDYMNKGQHNLSVWPSGIDRSTHRHGHIFFVTSTFTSPAYRRLVKLGRSICRRQLLLGDGLHLLELGLQRRHLYSYRL